MKVNIALLTVTDTRTFDNDKSGAILVNKIKEADHNLLDRKICKDNKDEMETIRRLLSCQQNYGFTSYLFFLTENRYILDILIVEFRLHK